MTRGDDLDLALAYVAGSDARMQWAVTWAPWLPREEVQDLITARPRWLKARALGERLGLTEREKITLGIEAIRPIDVSDDELDDRRRKNERDRKARERQKRRAKKPVPLSKAKPWEADGISRAQWYRRRKADETKSVRDNTSLLTADKICLTTPPADAVGTTQESIRPSSMVDGAAIVSNPDADRQRKTRFPTSMRLSRPMRAYATECGFEPEKIGRMWEVFRDFNIAQRTYSADWEDVWYGWVNREVDIVNQWHDRQRREYWRAPFHTGAL